MGPLNQMQLVGMNNPQASMAPIGPAALNGQRPGVPNPRQPMVHPMSTMLGGLRGALQMADHSLAGSGQRLHQMRPYARGGRHKPKLGPHGHHAVRTAIHHLQRGDQSSAIAALQSSPDAMQHPDVQQILAQLSQSDDSGASGTLP